MNHSCTSTMIISVKRTLLHFVKVTFSGRCFRAVLGFPSEVREPQDTEPASSHAVCQCEFPRTKCRSQISVPSMHRSDGWVKTIVIKSMPWQGEWGERASACHDFSLLLKHKCLTFSSPLQLYLITNNFASENVGEFKKAGRYWFIFLNEVYK